MDGRGPSAAGVKGRGDGRGQSETLGVVLVLAVVIIGTTAVVALGSDIITRTQEQSQSQQVEHAMTLLDASIATVALGDSQVRSIDVGRAEGTFSVERSAGRITVTHVNWDGTNDEVFFSKPLGAFVYKNGDTEIAYQGGGVWRHQSGGSSMVSPPEFYYRGATLTLPIIRVTGGGGSGSGQVTATVKKDPNVTTQKVFPDPSRTYTGSSKRYRNPTAEGRVIITVQSKYYRAWGSYFEARTNGNIVYDHANEEVELTLSTTGQTGPFQTPAEDSSLNVRGLEGGHSLGEFGITLRPDNTDSSDFSNLQWSLWAEGANGKQQFEIHLRRSGGGKTCSVPAVASMTVYYSGDGGATYQGWYQSDAFTASCDADGDVLLDATFLTPTTSGPTLTYQSLSQSQLGHFSPNGKLADSPTFDEHEATVEWEPKTYASGDTETSAHLLNHYFGLISPDFDLTVDDKNSNTVSEDASQGTIDYQGSDQYVTFLHVTENGVTIRVR